MLSISIENVSKLYHLGSINRGVLWHEMAAGLGLRPSRKEVAKSAREEFWALKDISFEIEEGETVGIIGANGAGKSTLLKILSRITSPTTGEVRINGRVGSLLEVGTGFNPEMTGRENVYLNGSIQGMKKPEIATKFDEIVSFAGVEKFIDTPVKRYSSGMYVRLAFSVAAFLQSEILIVDEVLSVGDQNFQNRCIQRLQDIIREGRTVLFVSHGAGLVRKICKRAICLKNGAVICDDEPMVALSFYQDSIHEQVSGGDSPGEGESENPKEEHQNEVFFAPGEQPGDETVRILSCRITDCEGNSVASLVSNSPFQFHMDFRILNTRFLLRPAAYVSDELANILFWTCDTNPEFRKRQMEPGCYRSTFVIPGDFLTPGVLTISAGLGEANETGISHALANDAIKLTVTDDLGPDSLRGGYKGPLPGFVRPRLVWQTNKIPDEAAGKAPQ